jgi:hypothetical protein
LILSVKSNVSWIDSRTSKKYWFQKIANPVKGFAGQVGHAEGGKWIAALNAVNRALNAAARTLEKNCAGGGNCDLAANVDVTYAVVWYEDTRLPEGGWSWDVIVEATGMCLCSDWCWPCD